MRISHAVHQPIVEPLGRAGRRILAEPADRPGELLTTARDGSR